MQQPPPPTHFFIENDYIGEKGIIMNAVIVLDTLLSPPLGRNSDAFLPEAKRITCKDWGCLPGETGWHCGSWSDVCLARKLASLPLGLFQQRPSEERLLAEWSGPVLLPSGLVEMRWSLYQGKYTGFGLHARWYRLAMPHNSQVSHAETLILSVRHSNVGGN